MDRNSDHPVIMSSPMVSATLRQSQPKTQTRRVMSPQPISLYLSRVNRNGVAQGMDYLGHMDGPLHACPYGRVGDRLWVRETWAPGITDFSETVYRADWLEDKAYGRVSFPPPARWRPAIHMPRARCRLYLGITGLRAERLQQITDEDALAEGIEVDFCIGNPHEVRAVSYLLYGGRSWGQPYPPPGRDVVTPRESYATLWDTINGKRPGRRWADDPLVWVILYEVLGAKEGS